jgi:hypothetical protein
MLAASSSLHDPKLPFTMTLANGPVGWFSAGPLFDEATANSEIARSVGNAEEPVA